MASSQPEPGSGRDHQDQPPTTHVDGSAMAVIIKALGPALPFEVKQGSQKKKTALLDRAGLIRPEGQGVAWAQVWQVKQGTQGIASEALHRCCLGPKGKEPHGGQIEVAKDLGNAAGADDRAARDKVRVITVPAAILKHSTLAGPVPTRGRPPR